MIELKTRTAVRVDSIRTSSESFFIFGHNYVLDAGCGYVVYMGKDKFENEDLIEWGLLTDLWFHVDRECVQAKLYIYIYCTSFLISSSTCVKFLTNLAPSFW